MNITIPMLLERLFNLEVCYLTNPPSKKGKHISNIKYLTNSHKTVESDVLYVANLSYLTSTYKGLIPQKLICIKDTNGDIDRRMFLNSDFILIENSMNIDELFDLLQDSFCYYSEILNDLLEIAEADRGLQTLTDKLATIFKNPISITNRNLNVLAASTSYKPGTTNREVFQRFFDEVVNRRDSDLLDDETYYLMEKYFHIMNRNDEPVSFDACERYKFPLISYNLKVHNKNVAMFNVFQVFDDFSDATHDKILFVSKFISLELQKNKMLFLEDGVCNEHLYIDLLKGNCLSEHEVDRISNYLNFSEGNNYILIVITSPMVSDYSNELSLLRTKLLTFIRSKFFVIHEGNMVIVLESSTDSFLTKHSFLKTKELLTISKMFAGISNPFRIFKEVKEAYLEAKKAVELGLKMNVGGQIFRYKDFQLYHLVDLCAKQEDIKTLCHPALLNLIELYPELSTTLYLYLRNGKSQAKTAKDLHIQRSSLLYRLKKIEEVLMMKLDDYQSLLHIQLSYELLNYLKLDLNPFYVENSAQKDENIFI